MGKSTISMAIFNSYVKLPEGTLCKNRCQRSSSIQLASSSAQDPREDFSPWDNHLDQWDLGFKFMIINGIQMGFIELMGFRIDPTDYQFKFLRFNGI